MDPKIEAFLAALNDFAESAEVLAEEWERASDALGDEAEGYPFPDSFDEVAFSIRQWCEKSRKRLAEAE